MKKILAMAVAAAFLSVSAFAGNQDAKKAEKKTDKKQATEQKAEKSDKKADKQEMKGKAAGKKATPVKKENKSGK